MEEVLSDKDLLLLMAELPDRELLLRLIKALGSSDPINQIFGAKMALIRRWYNGQRRVSPRYREKILNFLEKGNPLPDGALDCIHDADKLPPEIDFYLRFDRRTMIRRDGRIFIHS